MNLTDARELVVSGTSHQRLLAARRLAREASSSDRGLIKKRLLLEDDVYVRRVLGMALEVIDQGPPQVAEIAQVDLPTDRDLDAIASAGYREALDLFVHEIKPVLATLKRRARQELKGSKFEGTMSALDRLDDLVKALEQLSDASALISAESFDMTEAISELVVREFGDSEIRVVVPPQTPTMEAVGTRRLVEIIIRNAIRNAVDATKAVGSESPSDVVVAWGETNLDYWIVVLDRGIGLPEKRPKILEFGVSSKKDHRGAGLAISSQAATTIGGAINLDDRQDGGARFELRWPKENQDDENPTP